MAGPVELEDLGTLVAVGEEAVGGIGGEPADLIETVGQLPPIGRRLLEVVAGQDTVRGDGADRDDQRPEQLSVWIHVVNLASLALRREDASGNGVLPPPLENARR